MDDWKPSNCGRRLASIREEGLGYFFSSLGFITGEHLKDGLFIGGRKSELLSETSVSMRDLAICDDGIASIVDDCNM